MPDAATNTIRPTVGSHLVDVAILWGDDCVLDVQHLPWSGPARVPGAVARWRPVPLVAVAADPVATVDGGAEVGTALASAVACAVGQLELSRDGTTAHVPCGDLSVVASVAAGSAAVAGLFSPSGDWGRHAWTALSFVLHGWFLSIFYLMPGPGGPFVTLEPDWRNLPTVDYVVPMRDERDEVERPAWMRAVVGGAEPGAGARTEELADRTARSARPSASASASVASAHDVASPAGGVPPEARRRGGTRPAADLRLAGALGALSVASASGIWAGAGTVPALGSPSAVAAASGDLAALLAGADAAGVGGSGLGTTGHALGRTGRGHGVIGVGALGAIGTSDARIGFGSGYGSGAGGFSSRESRVPHTCGPCLAVVVGGLSREAVRRTVRRHQNEVRFCYERELATRPDLEGRVSVAFVIAPDGHVASATVSESTLGSAAAEACVATAVRRWTFPAVDDGGVTAVTYPFVFSPAESAALRVLEPPSVSHVPRRRPRLRRG